MKKILAVALVAALLSMIAIGGTLSYFKDDAYSENTMTVGKVDIIQNDSAIGDSYKLFPVTAAPDANGLIPANKNAIDKVVNVQLVAGSEDAYVRTLVAFQKVGGKNPVGDEIVVVWNDATKAKYIIDIEVDSIVYAVYEYTYATNKLTGTTTATEACMKQVYLASKVENNFNGGSYKIMVLSQGVQAQGFDTATEAFAAAFPMTDAAAVAGWFNR